MDESLLLTDLYQLTMLHGYWSADMAETAVFEFFVRKLPPERNFLVAAGLEQALHFIAGAHFTEAELTWLRREGRFPPAFIDHLAGWRFSGEVEAMPEGTIFFPDEPILRVTAPIGEAQLLESRLINILHLHTLLASKAVRCRLAAPGKQLVDFGMRRAHGAEAGLAAARASYLAGFAGTATVLAGRRFGIPLFGTMAHSYIEAHERESDAFASFARARGDNVVLLIDTYDTETGARRVVELAPRLARDGIPVKAVRLDSGDLAAHARQVRTILDQGGLHAVKIFCSGSLDEYRLADLVAAGAPIDGFGVGTHMDTSSDRPYLDCAYKLTEYAGRGRRKHSEGKATWPGRKQVYRRYGPGSEIAGDVITVRGDPQEGEPLLRPVMRAGRPLEPGETLESMRRRLAVQLERLPEAWRRPEPAPPFAVAVAPALRRLAESVDHEIAMRGG